ncbi:hypothetical protein HZB96_00125 [Candidatus Gottesmanbacteria bacterium]|nr:hypothetical protein [Candidatus Gottesmanbacteria bacterium]
MKKKCLICEEEAQYAIKNTKDYYCKECAEEQFGDITYLVSFAQKEEKLMDSEPVEEHRT